MTETTVDRPTTRVTWRRIFQYILDGILAGLLLAALGWLADRIAPGLGFAPLTGGRVADLLNITRTDAPWPTLPAGVLAVLVWAAVFVAVPLRWDRTPGMAVLGLRITRLHGGRPSPVQHVVRAVLLLVDGVGGGLLGWIVIVCSGYRQRIGDHAAGTIVVHDPT